MIAEVVHKIDIWWMGSRAQIRSAPSHEFKVLLPEAYHRLNVYVDTRFGHHWLWVTGVQLLLAFFVKHWVAVAGLRTPPQAKPNQQVEIRQALTSGSPLDISLPVAWRHLASHIILPGPPKIYLAAAARVPSILITFPEPPTTFSWKSSLSTWFLILSSIIFKFNLLWNNLKCAHGPLNAVAAILHLGQLKVHTSCSKWNGKFSTLALVGELRPPKYP
jgi:hypothetical protein